MLRVFSLSHIECPLIHNIFQSLVFHGTDLFSSEILLDLMRLSLFQEVLAFCSKPEFPLN